MTMVFNWKKQGRLYCPDGSGAFKTHAARPIPLQIDDDTLRIYYSSRDADDRMLPTYLDVDLGDPSQIKYIHDRPLVELGRPGCFDDSGVTLGSIVDFGDKAWLYYTGWKRRRVISFELAIGVLVWDKQNNTYQRMFEGPILAQDRDHPLLCAGPYVIKHQGRFRMWYCNATDWRFPNGTPEPIYTVYHALSEDGLNWCADPQQLIQYAFDGEVISAPWVLPADDGLDMWYSYRGHETREAKHYRIGYAHAADGMNWTRCDNTAGIQRSDQGWDSEMICYPAFLVHNDRTYMFYSGNGVGRGGLGWAMTEQPTISARYRDVR